GNTIVIGGEGDDTLRGGKGRGILIGGSGQDWMDGAQNDDILIGGRTTLDPKTAANDAALLDLLGTWGSDTEFGARVQALGGTLRSIVLDDGQTDHFTGGGRLDWFFGQPDDDFIDIPEQLN